MQGMRPVKLPKFKVCLMKYISMGSKMGTSELFMFDAYFKKHKKTIYQNVHCGIALLMHLEEERIKNLEI